MTRRLEGGPVADRIRERVRADLDDLAARGITPTLATVLMSDDPAARRFMDLKHEACAGMGIDTRDVRVDPDAPESALLEAIDAASADPGVHAVFVQIPLPEHVGTVAARERVAPAKDIDCFHPANLGRFVAGVPRIRPITTEAVRRLLSAHEVSVAGRDAVVVGRGVVGRPLASGLLRREPGGGATVTVCHSRTRDLAAKTRRADVLVTACSVPGLVDGSMLAEGAVVVDVSANRVEADTEKGYELVGDVDYGSAAGKVAAITPVPGGVGPVTVAVLLESVVRAAGRAESAGAGPTDSGTGADAGTRTDPGAGPESESGSGSESGAESESGSEYRSRSESRSRSGAGSGLDSGSR